MANGNFDEIGDPEAAKLMKESMSFIDRIDQELGVWQFSRTADIGLSEEVFEQKQRKVVIKW